MLIKNYNKCVKCIYKKNKIFYQLTCYIYTLNTRTHKILFPFIFIHVKLSLLFIHIRACFIICTRYSVEFIYHEKDDDDDICVGLKCVDDAIKTRRAAGFLF